MRLDRGITRTVCSRTPVSFVAPVLAAAVISLSLVGCSGDDPQPVDDASSASESPASGGWAEREEELRDIRKKEAKEAEAEAEAEAEEQETDDADEADKTEQEASPEAWSAWAVRTYQNLDGWEDSWKENGCDGIDLARSGQDVGFCLMSLNTMNLKANTVYLKYQTATDETNDGYLGPIDPSQKVTVEAVEKAALNAATYGKLSDKHCSGETKDSDCDLYSGMLRTYMAQLDAALLSLQ